MSARLLELINRQHRRLQLGVRTPAKLGSVESRREERVMAPNIISLSSPGTRRGARRASTSSRRR